LMTAKEEEEQTNEERKRRRKVKRENKSEDEDQKQINAHASCPLAHWQQDRSVAMRVHKGVRKL